jgi:hypothetical protein
MTLAQTEVDGQVDNECEEIEAYLKTGHAEIYIGSDPVWREAFSRLVIMPYEVETVADACERVAKILSLLRSDPVDRAVELFEYATRPERRPSP